MPGKGTQPGPELYPDCGQGSAVYRHRAEKTVTCAACRRFIAVETARRRKAKIMGRALLLPALGTHRRLRALSRMGWSQAEIGRWLGISHSGVGKILMQDQVGWKREQEIREIYRVRAWQLAPGVEGRLVRAHAAKMGWAGPLDWADIDNPDEIPACEIERAHADALRIHREFKKMLAKRERRAAMTPEERRDALEAQRQRRHARVVAGVAGEGRYRAESEAG
jgi:hypothetical protein